MAVKPKLVRAKLQEQKQVLEQDAYFSINAFWFDDKMPDEMRDFGRTKQRLRYLCAAFCDLDCHKDGITPGNARDRIRELERTGLIPPISGLIFSGRGLWTLWLIEEKHEAGRAQRAFHEKIGLYDDIQRALNQRLSNAGLAADSGAKDVCRIARIPGSLNSKSSAHVRYEFCNRPDGSPIAYTLADLKEHLGLNDLKHLKRAFKPAALKNPNKRRGWEALVDLRLREFERLRELRGGFREGCRNNAAMIYACSLRWKGHNHRDIEQAVYQLGRECHPRFTPSDCCGALTTGLNPKMRRLRDQTISDWLDITPSESAALEKLPPATRFGVRNTDPPKAARISAERRRRLIQRRVGELGMVPSTREMARILTLDGCTVSHVTIAADYKHLRQSTPRMIAPTPSLVTPGIQPAA